MDDLDRKTHCSSEYCLRSSVGYSVRLLSGRWFESKSCIKLNILINVHVAQLDRAHAS